MIAIYMAEIFNFLSFGKKEEKKEEENKLWKFPKIFDFGYLKREMGKENFSHIFLTIKVTQLIIYLFF